MAFDKLLYQSLSKLQKVCLTQNIPFVSYRLPLNREIFTLVQHHSMPEKLESLDGLQERTGFVVAPFTDSGEHATFFFGTGLCVFFK